MTQGIQANIQDMKRFVRLEGPGILLVSADIC